MKYLLDTNVISDARLQRSPSVMAWLAAQRVRDLAASVVTLLELERGVRRKERVDPAAGSVLRGWLDDGVRRLLGDRLLPIDERVVVTAASLHVPDPMPELDALIAATAIEHDLILVTRNVRDFERAPVRVLNPWT